MDNPQRLPRVLIVDESRSARAMLVRQLREHFDCREEADGEAAWQVLVLDHSIELVICSLSLPVLDGNGLLARVRSSRLPRLREMSMLMRYGDDEAALARARALGASAWLSRSADAAELLQQVSELHRRSQQIRSLDELPGGAQPRLGARHEVAAQAQAAVTQALRSSGEVSVLAVAFDHLDQLLADQGAEVVQQLLQRFAAMLAGKIRQEDGLGLYAEGVFVIVTPGTPSAVCEAFAHRLCESIHLASIVVHGRRLNLSVSVGVSNVPADAAVSGDALLQQAADRLQAARLAGGNRVVSCHSGVPGGAFVPRLDHAIALISAGHEDEVLPHLAHFARQLLPLLRLLDKNWKLGLPLADMEKRLPDPTQESNDAGRE